MRFILTGNRLLLGDMTVPGWLEVDQGKIVHAEEGPLPDGRIADFDAGNLWVTPGLVDVHVHGGFGHEFQDPDGIDVLRTDLLLRGTTAMLATLWTLRSSDYPAVLRRLGAVPTSLRAQAQLLGIHLEGPFLSVLRRGAHTERLLLAPDLDLLRTWQEDAAGRIVKLTLAPELPGAFEVIDQLVAWGASASIGHSDATYAPAAEAIRRGANSVTHFANGMRPMHHRDPGIMAAAAAEAPFVEIILDGIHLHDRFAKLFLLGPLAGRAVLITDRVRMGGLPPGQYAMPDGTTVHVDGAVYLSSGTLAGSGMSLADAVAHAISLGLSPEQAIEAASHRAATSIGWGNRKGRLAFGYDADIVVWERNLHPHAVMQAGAWFSSDDLIRLRQETVQANR